MSTASTATEGLSHVSPDEPEMMPILSVFAPTTKALAGTAKL